MIDPVYFGRWVTFVTSTGQRITMSDGAWRNLFKRPDFNDWKELAAFFKSRYEMEACGIVPKGSTRLILMPKTRIV